MLCFIRTDVYRVPRVSPGVTAPKLFPPTSGVMREATCNCQKRPATYAKETCYIRKRDLLYTQKRPAIYAKET